MQLTDAIRDRIVWGEHYSREFDDIFDIQDEITQVVVAATAVQIESSERERTRTLPPSDLRAYGYVLQGQQHIVPVSARREPDSAGTLRRGVGGRSHLRPRDRRKITDAQSGLALRLGRGSPISLSTRHWTLALKATELDETDARGFGELGFVHLYRKEHEAAISAYKRALLLNPNDADLMSDMADALAHSGRSDEAITLLEKAMRLNPFYPDQYLWHLGGAYYNLHRYEEAIETLQSMQNPTEGRRLLAASYAQLGRMEEARGHARKVLEAHPNFQCRALGERAARSLPDRCPALRRGSDEGRALLTSVARLSAPA